MKIIKVISIFILFILSAFLLISCQPENSKLKKLPNILFILADDLGYHDLSCTGSVYYETPNIDRIASQSYRFTNGYAACQVCSPSRASIMTGKAPPRHGITDWIGARSGESWRDNNRFSKLLPADYIHTLDSSEYTLAEALKDNGYATFFAGKWHLGGVGSYPEDHGFDINIGGWEAGSPHGGFYDPCDNPKLENEVPGEALPMRLARETSKFIDMHRDSSYFAFLSFYAVHAPLQNTQEKWKKYREKAAIQGVKNPGFEMERKLPIRTVQDNPIYAGLIETMDEAIGEVLKGLEDAGILDNTIIIFTSDNGGVASGDAYATCNSPLRGGKGYQWEGGLRVPFFISIPGTQGGNIETTAIGTDFYPTLMELAGIPLDHNQYMDGQSLVPFIEDLVTPEQPLYWHYPHYGNQGGEPSSVIREGRWKLIRYYEDGRHELYDLEEDPSEQINLAEQEPAAINHLSDKLDRWLEHHNALYPIPDPYYNPELAQFRKQWIVDSLLPSLEQKRRKFLSEDYEAPDEWWGSGK